MAGLVYTAVPGGATRYPDTRLTAMLARVILVNDMKCDACNATDLIWSKARFVYSLLSRRIEDVLSATRHLLLKQSKNLRRKMCP